MLIILIVFLTDICYNLTAIEKIITNGGGFMKKIIAVAFLVALILCSVSCEKNGKKIGSKIKFASSTPSVCDTTEFEYDLDELEKQISDNEGFVYLNPKKTDYKIVEKFGFDINDYEIAPSGERFYKIKDKKKESCYVDEFGAFSYFSDVQDTDYKFPYSNKECVKIAKDYLIQYGLWNDKILDENHVSYNESSTGTFENGQEISTLTGLGVNFFAKKVDGYNLAGNSRVSVEINGEGKVRSVMYNIREYEDKEKVDLISIKEAIENIKKDDAFIEVESDSDKLIFKNAHLSYWTQNRNKDNLIMQPVYVFSGTSITSDGSEEPFSITVQANEV